MNTVKVVHLSAGLGLALMAILSMQNCSKVEFAGEALEVQSASTQDPDVTTIPEVPAVAPPVINYLPEMKALVYGKDAQDRRLLAARIAGYAAPAMDEIFNNWRRISGASLINKASDINVAKSEAAYCYTSLLPSGLWSSVVPPGKTASISPSTDSTCIEQPWFSALSWFFINGRLHHATNSGNFNGFISGLKFDRYINQAVVTSSSNDDDEVAIIIAMVQDSAGAIHTLSASRSQGGFTAGEKNVNLNWRVIYRKNNAVVKVYGESEVGPLHRNSGSTGGKTGDGKGWSGRATLIKVERAGNRIRATPSNWAMNGALAKDFILDSTSRIDLDFDDVKYGLEIFKGAQFIGYGMQSQPATQFYDTSFTALSDDEFLYDLEQNLVYQQDASGKYLARKDLDAFNVLGFPRKIGNVETQKQYVLDDYKIYSLAK